ncbi:hypothetical protein [Prevotella sp. tc2-28]|uniref:hypothetical protein n=1 Tax=Prevotella sp. tc2-28 TaxID=1761888 RepID=UPI000AC42407|nr:hypothetical protein [Prevotella sp. tc2-28]
MIRIKRTFNLILTLTAMLTMAQTAMAAITGSGTADDPYLISSTEDWNTFANNVNNGTSYSGQTVKLNADISVTTMVGSWDNPFNGTFDGGGHTLSVTLNNDSQYGDEDAYYGVAPFRFTNGATFQFLVVTGIVTTSTRKYAAGLIGMTKGGTNTILNCISSVEIYSTINNKWGDNDGTHGGFIGKASGTVIINNCLFNGQLTTTSDNPTINCGGFVGWRDGNSTLSISNSLYAPNTTIPSGKTAVNVGATFSRNDVTPTNSYYTQTLGTAQGTAVGSKTAAQLVAALGSAWRVSSGRAVPKLLLSSKSFTIANASNQYDGVSVTTILYGENAFLVPTSDSGMQTNRKEGSVLTLRSSVGEEGIVNLYPRISGNVKSVLFSRAQVNYSSTVGEGSYLKIGKNGAWTNSYSETMSSYTSMLFSSENGMQLANEDDYLEIRMKNTDITRNASFFIQGTLTITYEPTEATETHRHNFTFSKNAEGNTLTATCAHDDNKNCELASSNYQITTTLTPPTHATYSQEKYHPATLSNIASFSNATKAKAGDITYVNNTTGASLGTSMPHDVGAYTASVTINADNYPYTLTTSFRVGTFSGINLNYPQFTTDKEGNYAIDGETVTLTFTSKFGETLTGVTATGATSGSDITLTPTGSNIYTFTMPAEGVNIGATFSAPDASHFEQNGDTYTIKTANGWGWFCFATNYDLAPDGFSGKVVKLAGNVSSSEMAGKSGHPFKGTFDGQNYTLTFNRTAAEHLSAPFHYINGATISNLHVEGTITGGTYESLGGLVGHAEGNITINNCHVSTEISTTVSGSALHGGVIGTWNGSYATCTVTGCVYDGLIYNPDEAGVTTSCRGFIGWDYGNNGTITFTDCLSAPAAYGTGKYALGGNCFTFVYPNSEPTLDYNMKNCYYTSILGNRQGRPAATATTAPGNLGNAMTDHGMVDGYENGFLYDGNYYTPKYGDAAVEYRFNDWNERADVTINGTGNNLVGVNITEEVGNIKSVTYNRPFNTAQAATVILPFSYICDGNEGSEGGKFYGFKEVAYDYNQHIWVCTMQEPGNTAATSLTANTPYLFMPNATTMTFPNISSMTGGVVTLQTTTANDGLYGGDTTDAAWNFHGSYKGKTWTSSDSDKDYGFAAHGGTAVHGEEVVAGQFVRFTTGAFIKPMRCYLSYVGTEAPAPARGLNRAAATDDLPQSITVRLVSRNGETTAIGEIDTKTGEVSFDSEAWYTLDGVRLSGKPSTKGIYINNGRKIVIR